MEDASLQFNLGSVGGRFGELKFSFIVFNNGNAHLQIWAHDPSDMRRSGVLIQVAEYGYRTLKQLLAKADETIEKLRASGQLLRMLVSYSTEVSIQVNLGSVESYYGQISFSIVVQNDGGGHLKLYASDPTNLRKSGVIVFCDEQGLGSLKQLVQKTDDLIGRLLAQNQMKQLVIAS
jgi:hypothetical protein